MITIRFEAYRNKKVFTGVDKITEEPVILNKLELIYRTEEYFEDNADPEIILDAFKETCLKQRYEPGESLFFDCFQDTYNGFVYQTHSANFVNKISILGWDDKNERTEKRYCVEQVTYDNENNLKTHTVFSHMSEEKAKAVADSLCPDYEWELDDLYIGFPITYCTQKGVTVTFDYYGVY